jgi:hypothetical protein
MMRYELTIRAKWLLDGCKTLTDAANALEIYAALLRSMEAAGLQLDDEIHDDYGFVYTEDAAIAQRFDMQKEIES